MISIAAWYKYCKLTNLRAEARIAVMEIYEPFWAISLLLALAVIVTASSYPAL